MRLPRFPLCLMIFFALSCHKKNIFGPAGRQGPNGANGADSTLKGNIQGKLVLYDTTGKPLADNSGATVSLENTSPSIQATTAADGSFTIQSVHAGAYNLSAQKQGFATMRFFNVINTGTQPASQTGLLSMEQQMPSSCDIKSLTVDSATYGSQHWLAFTAILAHPRPLHNPRVIIWFNDSTGVGNAHNKLAFWTEFYQSNDSTLIYYPFNFQTSGAPDKLAMAGKLYITVAVDNPTDLSYKDENGNIVFPGTAKPAPEVIFNNASHRY